MFQSLPEASRWRAFNTTNAREETVGKCIVNRRTLARIHQLLPQEVLSLPVTAGEKRKAENEPSVTQASASFFAPKRAALVSESDPVVDHVEEQSEKVSIFNTVKVQIVSKESRLGFGGPT
jgi:hypothetical protein